MKDPGKAKQTISTSICYFPMTKAPSIAGKPKAIKDEEKHFDQESRWPHKSPYKPGSRSRRETFKAKPFSVPQPGPG